MKTKNEAYRTVPPWVQLFLIHVVKRCAGVVIAWIDEMRAAEEQHQ